MIRLCVEECRAAVCTFNDSKRDANPWLLNLRLTGTKSVDSDGNPFLCLAHSPALTIRYYRAFAKSMVDSIYN